MGRLIWIHEDMLSRNHPVFAESAGDCEVVFVWDDRYFQDQGYSFKRLVFIYECLQDMDVTLYKGDTLTILDVISQGRDIHTGDTPSLYIHDVINTVSSGSKVYIHQNIPLTSIAANSDMGRFFRYWNRARKSALSTDGVVQG